MQLKCTFLMNMQKDKFALCVVTAQQKHWVLLNTEKRNTRIYVSTNDMGYNAQDKIVMTEFLHKKQTCSNNTIIHPVFFFF